MATWANALTENKLDIESGGPAIVWEIASHDIGISGVEDLYEARIDCRGKTAKQLTLGGITVESGTGVPKIYAVWMNEAGTELSEQELTVGVNKVVGLFVMLRVRETGGAAIATYSAAVRLD